MLELEIYKHSIVQLEDWQRELFTRAFNFAKDELLTFPSGKVHLSIDPEGPATCEMRGRCCYIILRKGKAIDMLVEFFHEMKHAEQNLCGRLRWDTSLASLLLYKKIQVIFAGKKYHVAADHVLRVNLGKPLDKTLLKEYLKWPWEAEAFEFERLAFDLFAFNIPFGIRNRMRQELR